MLEGREKGEWGRKLNHRKKERDIMQQVTVTEPAVLIRIQKSYNPKMSHQALYEVTRGVWKVGSRREQVEIALAVFDGIVREVFRVAQWHPAGSTTYTTRQQ